METCWTRARFWSWYEHVGNDDPSLAVTIILLFLIDALHSCRLHGLKVLMLDVCFGIPSREVCRQLHVKLGMSKHESRHDKLKMMMLQVFVFLFLLLLGRLYQLFARKPWLTVYRAHTRSMQKVWADFKFLSYGRPS